MGVLIDIPTTVQLERECGPLGTLRNGHETRASSGVSPGYPGATSWVVLLMARLEVTCSGEGSPPPQTSEGSVDRSAEEKIMLAPCRCLSAQNGRREGSGSIWR